MTEGLAERLALFFWFRMALGIVFSMGWGSGRVQVESALEGQYRGYVRALG